MNRIFIIEYLRRSPREEKPVFGPQLLPFSYRLLQLADELQDKLTEWEYKQLCDLAHERFREEENGSSD